MPMFKQRIRRGLLVAASVVAVAAVTLGVAAPKAWAASGDLDLLPPEYSKTARDNGDGTATITLSVKGDSNTSTEREPIDVVLVVDVSNSMKESAGNRQSRMQAAHNAAAALAEELLDENNAKLPDAQQTKIAVVEFGTHVLNNTGFTTSAQTVSNSVRVAPASGDDGGTNWEAGLAAANAKSTGRKGAKKYIVFLTDGNPTFHDTKQPDKQKNWWTIRDEYNYDYKCYGDGNGDDHGFNYDAAVTEANKRGNASLYVVKAASDAGKADNFAQDVKAANGGEALDGTTAAALKSAFQNIATEIKRDANYVNVSMTDQLSQWVEWNTADGQTVDPSTFTYKKNGKAWTDAPKATVDGDNLKWDLASVRELEKDTTYSISFTVKIKDETYEDAASDNPKFENGEYRTNAGAQLTYTAQQKVNGTVTKENADTKNFETPTIKIPVNTVTVTKKWADGSDNHDAIEVNVGTKKVTLDKDGKWTATVKLPVSRKDQTYNVSEVAVPGYTSSADKSSITFKGRTFKAASDSVAITNTPITGVLKVSKHVQGSAANKDKKYRFTVTVDDAHKAAVEGKTFGGVTFDGNGSATFELAHGETASITGLPYGSSYTVVESGIDTNATTKTWAKVNGAEAKDLAITNQVAESVDVPLIQKDDKYAGTVDFTNSSTAVPDNGVDISNAGPMVTLFGMAVLGGVAMWETNRRKSGADARKE